MKLFLGVKLYRGANVFADNGFSFRQQRGDLDEWCGQTHARQSTRMAPNDATGVLGYDVSMPRPQPVPAPANSPSPFERFQALTRRILTTPKAELVKEPEKKQKRKAKR